MGSSRLLIVKTAAATMLVVALIAWCTHTPPTVPPQATFADLKQHRRYVKGNVKSMIYHVPGCLNYETISEENVERFETEEDAEDAGYRKARNCTEAED